MKKKMFSKLLINEAIAKEAYNLEYSKIGIDDYAKYVRRYNLFGKRFGGIEPFDGYIIDFRKIDTMAIYSSIYMLVHTFGPDRTYDCAFVSMFEEIKFLSLSKVTNPQSLSSAIENGIRQGMVVKSGFLVLTVNGNDYRPKDLLIWSHIAQNWISYNRSKAYLLRHNKAKIIEAFKSENDFWAWELQKQGVVVRPDYCKVRDYYDDPDYIRVSTDGLNWYRHQLADSSFYGYDMASEIWDAWLEDIVIHYDRHTHTVMFSSIEDGIMCYNLDGIHVVKHARKSGYSATQLSHFFAKIHLNKDDFPNCYIRQSDGTLEPFTSFTFNFIFIEYYVEDYINVLNRLKAIAPKVYSLNPQRLFIINKEKLENGDFVKITECITTE